MPLASGTKLGPYEIQSPLGAGGMGEVYRALDTRLNRVVAIKVLASNLSASPELKQRLEREARAISSLNHPHICQLYDIGSQGGTDFLVMEYLEGETLAERLRKGAIPLTEIYKIGIAVAEALSLAHRQGIVHRDLKPGNIMLTPSGAKLMDFGLAKPLSLAATGSASAPPSFTAAATLSGPSPLSPLTTAGTIIGTIQYMAPEQIEGKEADARSDIFAFGAVLYEMASGKRPFEGKSQISLASSILEKDPDPISAVKPETPTAFDHVVTTCLQKNPEDRFLAAHDIKLELQWIATEKPSAPLPVSAPAAAKGPSAVWIAVLIGAVVLGAAGGFLLHPPARAAQSIRTVINPPEKMTLNLTGDSAGPPVLSPDGGSIAFTASSADGKTTLWVRPINSLESHQLAGSENAVFPFWSPDSHALGFFADGKLKTIDVSGDSPQIIADAPFGRGGAWGPGGVILFSPSTQAGLMRVSASGGTAVEITKLDRTQHTSHRWPFFLPNGKHFIYLAISHDPSKAANNALYYASLDGRENHLLLHSQSNAVYAGGYLLFARGDQLMAQAFNPSNGALGGDEPQSVAKGLMNDIATWHMDASASDDGLLIFGSGGTGDWQLLWMDRNTKQLSTIADKLSNLQIARLSPQGDRIAMQIDTGANDIWVLDLARGVRTRLTFGPVSNMFPAWSPDGKWIVYTADRNGRSNLCRKRADGSGAEETLLTDEQLVLATDWSRDSKYLVYMRGPVGNTELWALPLQGERKPFVVVPRSENTFTALGRLSPDGHWLAYASNESGAPQVYVVAFGGGQGKWQVSVNGGMQPTWSKDGKQLYYFDPSYNLFAVPVKESGGALQFGSGQQLLSNWSAPQVFYDVSPDGKKILLDRISQQVNQSVTVVTNFTSGLRK
ncbi:MAG TPA: protein kinase [Candidatus Sulfotelmatobacter sp.]|nr:protein kinase [Candidatus Sulfotelmatobacter sp.]